MARTPALTVSLLLFVAFPWAVSSASDDRSVPRGTRLELSRDEAPPPKPWADWPTLEQSLGEPGWRHSTEPLCEDAFVPHGFDVWSDERGVFARVWRRCEPNRQTSSTAAATAMEPPFGGTMARVSHGRGNAACAELLFFDGTAFHRF